MASAHPRCTDSRSPRDTGTHGSSCSGDPVVAGMTAHLQSQLLTAGSNKDFINFSKVYLYYSTLTNIVVNRTSHRFRAVADCPLMGQ